MKYLSFVLFIVLISCGSASKPLDAAEMSNLENLKTRLQSGNFEVESDFANPTVSNGLNQLANANILGPGNNASSINITQNSNFLKFKNDSVSAILPFYGTRNFAGRPGSGGGIEFSGIPEDYKIQINERRKTVGITFSITDPENDHDNYEVRLDIFSNLKTDMHITSGRRSPISYSGGLRFLSDNE